MVGYPANRNRISGTSLADGIVDTVECGLLSNLNVAVAVSKSMQTVKRCSKQMLQFFTD